MPILYNEFFDFGDGSNLRSGQNPPYTSADFLASYPQFDTNVIPAAVLTMYVNLANASIQEARWHDAWYVAMGWFIAHFCTLYLQGSAAPGSPAAQVMAAAEARGLKTSKSVGDVSVGIDYADIAKDLDGWGSFKMTIYGQQLATMGRLTAQGGMYIW